MLVKRRPAWFIASMSLVLITAVAAVGAVAGQRPRPGSLDRSFGHGGQVTTRMSAVAANLAFVGDGLLQPDGKVVAIGEQDGPRAPRVAAVRYAPDGSLDPSFGSNGVVTTGLGSSSRGVAAALQPDGKLVVLADVVSGGTTNLALLRYASDGTRDTAFGNAGLASVDLGGSAAGSTVAVQSDGRILVGAERSNGGQETLAVARFSADGSPDTAFGSAGIATAGVGPTGPATLFGTALVVQPDGKVVAAGIAGGAFAVARFTAGGTLDGTFGGGGVATKDATSGSYSLSAGVAAALQPDGSVVVAGSLSEPVNNSTETALVRFQGDGSPDPAFGIGGLAVDSLPCCSLGSHLDVALQPTGSIIVGGHGYPNRFDASRFNADGSIDPSFGAAGTASISLGAKDTEVAAVATDATGGITVIGDSIVCKHATLPSTECPPTASEVGVARFTADGAVDPAFGGAGYVTTTLGTHPTRGAATARAILAQPKRRIVVVGAARAKSGKAKRYEFALARHRSDGSLDGTFGARGRVVTDVGGAAGSFFGEANDAIPGPGGAIVVAGSRQSANGGFDGMVVARYRRDGSLDPSFGSDGVADVRSSFQATGTAVAPARGDKIVVAGSDRGGLAVARFNADGSLDTSFANDGELLLGIGSRGRPAIGVVVTPRGEIVAAEEDALIGIRPDGSLDASFGQGGVSLVPVGEHGYLNGLVRRGSRLLAFGASSRRVALFRYGLDGSRDRSFGRNGVVITRAGPFGTVPQSATLGPNGKLLLAGSFHAPSPKPANPPFGLLRFNRDGSLDRSFGDRGRVASSVHGIATAVAPFGRRGILEAGRTFGGDVRLARFRG